MHGAVALVRVAGAAMAFYLFAQEFDVDSARRTGWLTLVAHTLNSLKLAIRSYALLGARLNFPIAFLIVVCAQLVSDIALEPCEMRKFDEKYKIQ